MDNNYVYKKEVDWSLLNQGVSIPLNIQVVFQKNISSFLKRGQSKDIFILLEGKSYKAELRNQLFDDSKYPNRSDILQIRYNPQSELAHELRKIFNNSYNFVLEKRSSPSGSNKKFIKIPLDKKEFLAIYATPYMDTYYFDCITTQEAIAFKESIINEDESDYEKSINYIMHDENARIDTVYRTSKIRRLSRSIGDNLKLLYDYKCQICGENIGSRYGVNIVEAHHISPFVSTLNNDAINQIIICPNHHRVIHKSNPIFERKKLSYIYSNGLVEKILLNKHL